MPDYKKFFADAKQMSEFIPSQKATDSTTIFYHLSGRHFRQIFAWVASLNGQKRITHELNISDNKRSALFNWRGTNLYITLGVVVQLYTDQLHLFFHTNSTVANHENDIRLKEPAHKKTKEVDFRNTKKIKRGYFWTSGMKLPQPIAIAVLYGMYAMANANREEKFSNLLGSTYANPGFRGRPFYGIKFRTMEKIHYYAPLAPADLNDWVSEDNTKLPKNIPEFKGSNPDQLLAIIYKLAKCIAVAHHLGLILRDFKLDNCLVFFWNKMYPLKIVLTDLSTCMEREEKIKTHEGTFVYCSPEHPIFETFRYYRCEYLKSFGKYREALNNEKLLGQQLELIKLQLRGNPGNLEYADQELKIRREFTLSTAKVKSEQYACSTISPLMDQEYNRLYKQTFYDYQRTALEYINRTPFVERISPDNGITVEFLPDQKDDFWSFCISIERLLVLWKWHVEQRKDQKETSSTQELPQLILNELKKNIELPRRARNTMLQFIHWFEGMIDHYKSQLPITFLLMNCLNGKEEKFHHSTRIAHSAVQIFNIKSKTVPPRPIDYSRRMSH
ncbi:MAG: hypothetical protein JSR33_03760 [Proteobacteria bacterium]|nr:hypothetical protein [Pseudomonadota bacterium]